MPVKACVFDAYGTLFDVAAAARIAADEPGAEGWAALWPQLAADWRRKQLEYTWLRASAGAHADFWQVTCDGLDWALDASDLARPALRERLLALYRELPAFPEVAPTLSRLRGAGLPCAILSNGSPDMLVAAVRSAGIGVHLDAVISVEEIGVFKPDPRVYALTEQHLNIPPQQTLFVSSNCWDACCAAARGFVTLWVNRDSAPMDRLHGRPAHVAADLSALPELTARL